MRKIYVDIISIIFIFWIIISLLSSVFVGFNQMSLDNNIKNRYFTYGCETDMPWIRIFYSKLFCQIK